MRRSASLSICSLRLSATSRSQKSFFQLQRHNARSLMMILQIRRDISEFVQRAIRSAMQCQDGAFQQRRYIVFKT